MCSKLAVVLLCATSLFGQWPQSIQNFATFYTGSLDPVGQQPAIEQFLARRFNVAILPYVTQQDNNRWLAYLELADSMAASNEQYDMRDSFAAPAGYCFECLFQHHSVDFKFSSDFWNGYDRFDFFERNTSGNYVNGVLAYNGATFSSDNSTSSYTGGTLSIHDTLYVGYMLPFDQMNFVISVATNGTVAYQYWNGSTWATLTPQSDGTSGLRATGKVYWYPPADWVVTSVNSSRNKYWVRIVVSGASTWPVYSTVKGDALNVASPNLCNGAACNQRGWDSTNADGHHQNVGSILEYDPNPPANATARFQYQSRLVNYSVGYAYHNDSYVSGSDRVWAKWMEWKLASSTYEPCLAGGSSSPCTGIMFDDLANLPPSNSFQYCAAPCTTGAVSSYLDFNQGSTLQAERQATYSQLVSDLHSTYGGSFLVTGNNPNNFAIAELGNQTYAEFNFYKNNNTPGGNANAWSYPNPAGSNYITYDALLPVNNTAGIIGQMLWCEYPTSTITPGNFGSTIMRAWDRGNRGPMAALAGHYIGNAFSGSTNYTGFSYLSTGCTSSTMSYPESDQVYTYVAPTTLTAQVNPGTGATFTVASAAGCSSGNTNAVIVLGATTQAGGETVQLTSINGNQLTATQTIYYTHNVGDPAYCVQMQRQSQLSKPPPVSTVWRWAVWFPARGVDIGLPDAAGLNGGARIVPWKKGGSPDYISGQSHATCDASGKCPSIYRRDYTRAIVLYREELYQEPESELDTPSQPIVLGATYYPLLADGTTGAGITAITLRAAEGAVLMKAPFQGTNIRQGTWQGK